MSNFYCPTCNKAIIDSPGRDATGCVHFPKRTEKKEDDSLSYLKQMFDMK